MNKTDKKIKMVKLGEVCEIIAGQSPPSTTYNNKAVGLPFYQGKADFGERNPIVRKWCSDPVKIAKNKDILISVRAPVGPTNIAVEKCCIGRGLSAIRCKNEIYMEYLLHFLRWFESRLESQGKGATFKAITQKDLKSIQIPLPPLAEQKRIAEILDLADEARRKRKKNLALYDDLIRSLFLKTFGDPVNNQYNFSRGTIRELINEVKYGTSKKADTSKGEYPVLRMGNITYDGNWNFSSLKYCDLEKEELDKYLVHNGDMLFNRTNSRELVGKTAVFREKNPMAYAGYLIRVRPNKYANIEFLSAHLNSKWAKQYLSAKCKSIVGMANINAQELQDIPILIPPLDLQNQFAKQVEEINQQKAREQALYDQHDNLFNALLQRAFKEML